MATYEINGVRVAELDVEGDKVVSGGDANDLISAAWSDDAHMVAVPVARFGAEFFTLRSGLAGEIFQKFQNYRVRLAVVGDISAHVAASSALRDFVYETNAVGHHLFVETPAALKARLSGD